MIGCPYFYIQKEVYLFADVPRFFLASLGVNEKVMDGLVLVIQSL